MDKLPLAQCPLCGTAAEPEAVEAGIKAQFNNKVKLFIFGVILGGFLKQLLIIIS